MLPEDVPLVGKISDNLCLSGGAKGADTAWGEEAFKAGHQVIHWSFEGHKCFGAPEHTIKLDEETLKQADERLEMANESLKRHLSYHKPWLINLLRRNWFQVQHAEEVWVVGALSDRAAIKGNESSSKHPDKLGIDGGTAWACQMYLDRFREKQNELAKISPLPADPEIIQFKLIFYDQIKRKVYCFNPAWNCWCWQQIDDTILLPPKGIYAAIGSRDLQESGKAYIWHLYNDPR